MQKIIISGKNNRGNETRISTKETSQNLEIYFQGVDGEIRKATVCVVSNAGVLEIYVANETSPKLSTFGVCASKLPPNR